LPRRRRSPRTARRASTAGTPTSRASRRASSSASSPSPYARSVLDPFAGCGTTPLVASHAGLRAATPRSTPSCALGARQARRRLEDRRSRREGTLAAFRRAEASRSDRRACGRGRPRAPALHVREAGLLREPVLRKLLAAVSGQARAERRRVARRPRAPRGRGDRVPCSNMSAPPTSATGEAPSATSRARRRARSPREARLHERRRARSRLGARGRASARRDGSPRRGRTRAAARAAGEFDLALTSPPY